MLCVSARYCCSKYWSVHLSSCDIFFIGDKNTPMNRAKADLYDASVAVRMRVSFPCRVVVFVWRARRTLCNRLYKCACGLVPIASCVFFIDKYKRAKRKKASCPRCTKYHISIGSCFLVRCVCGVIVYVRRILSSRESWNCCGTEKRISGKITAKLKKRKKRPTLLATEEPEALPAVVFLDVVNSRHSSDGKFSDVCYISKQDAASAAMRHL